MKISVIIPVYNAEKYLEKAVDSVLLQPEVGEIILVEDKSPDNALAICEVLAEKYKIIKLFQHPDKGNHGAGASRNLGIKHASCNYVAFLDADDYYLPGRFEHESKNFVENNNIEGVYGALGFHHYSEVQKKRYELEGHKGLTTIQKNIPSGELFNALIGLHEDGNIGHIHLNTLTVKKSVFDKVGVFNVDLRLHQDYEWLMRASAKCNFVPGSIHKAIGMRGVHEENRIINKSTITTNNYKIKLWISMLQWANKNNSPKNVQVEIEKKLFIEKANAASKVSSLFLLLKYPFQTISYNHSTFENLVYKTFGRNTSAKIILGLRNKIAR